MKRWLSILLLLVLSAGLLVPTAWAEEDADGAELMGASTVVRIIGGSAEPGGTVSVQVTLPKVSYHNLSLEVGYRSDALELTKVETGHRTMQESEDYTYNPYVLLWNSGNEGDVQWQGGAIATLTFRVKPETKPGAYPVTIAPHLEYGAADGTTVNFWMGESSNPKPLFGGAYAYQNGDVTVVEPPCAVTAESMTGGGFTVTMTGPDLDGKLAAAWYTADGQMKQVRLLAPKASQEVGFSQAAKGDLVKFMWLADSYVPRCEAAEKTVT